MVVHQSLTVAGELVVFIIVKKMMLKHHKFWMTTFSDATTEYEISIFEQLTETVANTYITIQSSIQSTTYTIAVQYALSILPSQYLL
jgi:hypothetical protein